MHKYDLAKDILWATQHPDRIDYHIQGAVLTEVAIAEFIGRETELTNKKDKEILGVMDDLMEPSKAEM